MIVYLSSKNTSSVTLSGDVMAMYSPQPVYFNLKSTEFLADNCRITITDQSSGESISEERATYWSGDKLCADFEISRMLQLVCDTETIFQNADYHGGNFRTGAKVTIAFALEVGGVWTTAASTDVEILHGCCDWGEKIGAAERRRLWINFPQTIGAGTQEDGLQEIVAGNDSEEWVGDDSRTGWECDLYQTLVNLADPYAAQLAKGKTCKIKIDFPATIADGEGTIGNTTKEYTLVPQLDKFGTGTYLRWLHRDGSIGYWLFKQSKETHTIAQAQSYSTHIEGDPATPQYSTYRNAVRQTLTHGESMTIGTAGVTEDEYAYLLGLAESPIVDMLVSGTRENPLWARVTISAATYTKNVPKSGLSRLRDFELTIALPERNTIRL